MLSKKLLINPLIFVTGIIVGAISLHYLYKDNNVNVAQANLYAAYNSIENGDHSQAMIHANAVLNAAPYAFNGYEIIGYVYESMDKNDLAEDMYTKAIDMLRKDGERAMLVIKDVVTPGQAIAHLEKRINEL